jgi:hypothetical protein
LGEIKGIS